MALTMTSPRLWQSSRLAGRIRIPFLPNNHAERRTPNGYAPSSANAGVLKSLLHERATARNRTAVAVLRRQDRPPEREPPRYNPMRCATLP
jgi:hypothetical protein